ncbi:MAG: hypothetical protein GX347_02110 [Epulopiscium sp.]|mgnify:CR=1 FL=1|nr:hypothetical protein [Candidatus Epulonipiscium sp.]
MEYIKPEIILIIMLMMGICFILVGLWFYQRKKQPVEVSNVLQLQKQLELKIQEGQDLVEEMNDFTIYMVKELENKHKELILLYQLINEKEEQMEEKSKKTPVIQDEKIEQNLPKKQKQVIDLYKQGNTIDTIAKKLQLGKGEVQLIIGLFQKR